MRSTIKEVRTSRSKSQSRRFIIFTSSNSTDKSKGGATSPRDGATGAGAYDRRAMHSGHSGLADPKSRQHRSSVRDKTSIIRMVQSSSFTGKEDANLNLQAFLQLCHTFDMQGMTQDQIRARLFPFSLLGRALQWFHSLPPRTVQNWESLMKEFMTEFYSPGKTEILRNKIAIFAQAPTETIAEAYERFNDYIRAVPHHKFSRPHYCIKGDH